MSKAPFNIWAGVYRSFADAPSNDASFLSNRWVEKCVARAAEARARCSTIGRSIPEGAQTAEYNLSVAAALAARPGSVLRIVDFGGAAGDSYFALRPALPPQQMMEFYVVEHAAVCAAARKAFADVPELRFCETIDRLPTEADVAHAGSSLQYVDDWRGLLAAIDNRCHAPLLVLSDVPAGDIETFVTLQTYYEQRMPHRFWNLDEFIANVESLGFGLLHRTRYIGIFLGQRGDMPTQNFDDRHRLKNACHLIFRKS